MDMIDEMRRQIARASFDAEQRGAPHHLRVDLEGALAALAFVPERSDGLRPLLARGRAALERWQEWRASVKRSR